MKQLISRAVVLLLFIAALAAHAQQEPIWEIRGRSTASTVDFTIAGEVIGNNGVVVSNRDVVLSADRVVANQVTGEVQAQGQVTILGKNHIWEGTNIVYNFKTREMKAGTFKTAAAPLFIEGTGLGAFPEKRPEEKTNEVYSARNGFITTDDYDNPLYKIRARVLIIVPGKYVEAYDATLMLGSVPVFYVPYYKRTLGRHPNNYSVTPGYQSTFGAFLLNNYNWYANEKVDGAVHFDMRSARGFAGGPEINYHLGPWGEGTFKYYYARDQDPNADAIAGTLPTDRKRISFTQFAEPDTNLFTKIVARYQSDPQVIRDFFESEYRTNVQPSTFAEVSKLWPNYTLDVVAQPRIVNFFETVERLPDVKLSAARQEVGVTPIYYEGESSFAYLRRRFSDTNEMFQDYSAARADTYHQFVLPQTYFGCINVVPRVGARGTYYSDVYGTTVETNDQARGVFNTGAEVSTKASQLWRSPQSDFFEVDGLRHIIEPSVNYVYVPSPSRSPLQLPQFDYATPSLRPLPIEFPEFNSIDSIDTENVIRLTLRNKLQTKRDELVDNLVNWAVMTDWRLDPRDNETRFSDVFSQMDLKPRSWLYLNSEIRWDVQNSRFRETYNRILLQPNNTWNVSLSHRYLLNNDPEFQTFPGEVVPGDNSFTSSIYYRMNENWAARTSQRFQGRNGTLEEQYYTIYRDLRSWTSALTFRVINNYSGQKTDYTVAVTFSLKSFPRFGLGSDTERPSSLIGG